MLIWYYDKYWKNPGCLKSEWYELLDVRNYSHLMRYAFKKSFTFDIATFDSGELDKYP